MVQVIYKRQTISINILDYGKLKAWLLNQRGRPLLPLDQILKGVRLGMSSLGPGSIRFASLPESPKRVSAYGGSNPSRDGND